MDVGYHTSLLVVQSTPFCNIDCTYCYLSNRSSKKQLGLQSAELFFSKIFRFPSVYDQLTIVWHAGEPLVLPPSYYEQMFELIGKIAPSGLKIYHSFQTNGTLITDAWCDLIKKWNLSFGVSIDGPAEIHNRYRKQRNGAGSFDRTIAGMRKLQSAGIPFHVISVLTVESMTKPEQMLDFYVENGIKYVCFNVEESEGAHVSNFVKTQADALYREFFERFIDLSIQRQSSLLVREVEASMRSIQGLGSLVKNVQAEPFGIVSVDCDGNVSTFSPELLGLIHERYGTFNFGNLHYDDFGQIEQRVNQSQLAQEIAKGVQACEASCEYYNLCGGGAPANKIYENGSAATTETVHCRTLMRSIDVVLNLIERLPPVSREIAARASELYASGPLHGI